MRTPPTDAELMHLLDRIAAHDEAALKTLYEQTSSKLFGLALRVLGHRDWAEDVLQEAFITIWRVAGDYRASLSPPMAWMGLIVRSRDWIFCVGERRSARTSPRKLTKSWPTRWHWMRPPPWTPPKPANRPGRCTSASSS